eukprot:176882-Chlamydomonas_euryale.AAC.1
MAPRPEPAGVRGGEEAKEECRCKETSAVGVRGWGREQRRRSAGVKRRALLGGVRCLYAADNSPCC